MQSITEEILPISLLVSLCNALCPPPPQATFFFLDHPYTWYTSNNPNQRNNAQNFFHLLFAYIFSLKLVASFVCFMDHDICWMSYVADWALSLIQAWYLLT